jgi:D-glycero-D-manno-heptose 1,7-bisphosphate phosphatase
MRLVILDRDGVINEDADAYIKSVEEWVPVDGSLEAMARLYHGGVRMVVATNQSGLARGLFTIDDLNAMHRKLYRELSLLSAQVEAIFFCPHGPDAGCQCRKPRPGLLQEIGSRFQVDLAGVPCVGDSYRDVVAARAVGATPILVRTGKGERTLRAHRGDMADVAVYADLSAVADALLGS